MRRITLWVLSTVAALVLLFNYRTSTMGATPSPALAAAANPPGIVSGPAPAEPANPGSGGPIETSTPPPGASAAPKRASRPLVVNGTVVQTPYGPVQVQVHITNGRITDVVPLQLTSGKRRDDEINAYAVPRLHDEALTAQSANIDVVSGATYTSDGYITSLQAALDAAHTR
ncbi:FMN-binding protein [Micromonospora sp. NPDC093277]|uniref:FMN-binding protein n=1 Tax=Micromonospora sp. NPDC093277 TaxID=3364291 RepID=UPI0037F36A2B